MAKGDPFYCPFEKLSEVLLGKRLPQQPQQQQLQQQKQVFHTVVFPERPPIDKVGVLVLVENRQPKPIEEIAFWGNPECSSRQLDAWRAAGILPVDLGPEKYNRFSDVGSAAEFVSQRFCMDLSSAEMRLIGVLNRNNRTGYLKGFHMSTAFVMRGAYELGVGEKYDHAEIVSRVGHVIYTWLQDDDGVAVPWRPEEALAPALPDLVEKTRSCSFAPFTIAHYMRGLWRSGLELASIRERVEWWLEVWDEVQRRQEEAKKVFLTMQWRMGKNEWCCGEGLRLRMVKTEDKFLVRAVAKSCDVVIVKNPTTGHVAILGYGCDLQRLAGELIRKEPECWYLARPGFLLNGSRMYTEGRVTALEEAVVVELMLRYPPRLFSGPRR